MEQINNAIKYKQKNATIILPNFNTDINWPLDPRYAFKMTASMYKLGLIDELYDFKYIVAKRPLYEENE